jgi:hypothetical protein
VFGFIYNGVDKCNLTLLSKCNTVSERMQLIPNERFDLIAKELYYTQSEINDDTTLLTDDLDDGGYWSDSSDIWNDPIYDMKTTSNANHGHTFVHKYEHNRSMQCGEMYNFSFWTLKCSCCFAGSTIITVGDDDYLQACTSTERWFEFDFIQSFATLCAHMTHNEKIQLIHCQSELSNLTEEECRALSPTVQQLISVVFAQSHFAICTIDITTHRALIYDSLNYPLKTWLPHVINIVKRCRLLGRDHVPVWKTGKSKSTYLLKSLVEENQWRVGKGKPFLMQKNSYDCGPITCLKIMSFFDRFHLSEMERSSKVLRRIVVEEYKALLSESKVPLPPKKQKEEENITPVSLRGKEVTEKATENIDEKSIKTTSTTTDVLIEKIKASASKLESLRSEIKSTNDVITLRSQSKEVSKPKMLKDPPSVVKFNTGIVLKTPNKDNKEAKMREEEKDSTPIDFLSQMTECSQVSIKREIATGKKRRRQDEQAAIMKRVRQKHGGKAKVGDIIAIQVDYRDVSHPMSVHGVVFEYSNRGAGGCRVVTETGIIRKAGNDSKYFIPISKYKVLDLDVIVSSELRKLQQTVVDGTFIESSMKQQTIQKIHEEVYGLIPESNKVCKCKNKCKMSCGCVRNNRKCTVKCGCKGMCDNLTTLPEDV